MTTRTRSRKPNPFPVIQDTLTPEFETYSTEDGFAKLTDALDQIKAGSRNLKGITKQVKLLQMRVKEIENIVAQCKQKLHPHDAEARLVLHETSKAVKAGTLRAERYMRTAIDQATVDSVNEILRNLRACRSVNDETFRNISNELDSIQAMTVAQDRSMIDSATRREGKLVLILISLLLVPVLVNKYFGV